MLAFFEFQLQIFVIFFSVSGLFWSNLNSLTWPRMPLKVPYSYRFVTLFLGASKSLDNIITGGLRNWWFFYLRIYLFLIQESTPNLIICGLSLACLPIFNSVCHENQPKIINLSHTFTLFPNYLRFHPPQITRTFRILLSLGQVKLNRLWIVLRSW